MLAFEDVVDAAQFVAWSKTAAPFSHSPAIAAAMREHMDLFRGWTVAEWRDFEFRCEAGHAFRDSEIRCLAGLIDEETAAPIEMVLAAIDVNRARLGE